GDDNTTVDAGRRRPGLLAGLESHIVQQGRLGECGFSHRGSYYTLDETAHFDESGLWSFQSVWFSRQGTLLDTAQAFVENSSAGHFAEELDHLLHVGTKEPLLRLVQHERVAREPVGGLYLYCSMNPVLREHQLLARHVLQAEPNLASSLAKAEVVSDELKAAIILFSSMLNEKQRRLYAGLENRIIAAFNSSD